MERNGQTADQDPGGGEESSENRTNQDRSTTVNSQPPILSEVQSEQQAHNPENAAENPKATGTSASLDLTLDSSTPSAQDNPQTNSSHKTHSDNDKYQTNDEKARISSASLDFILERLENAAEQSSDLAQRSSSPGSSADRPTLDFVVASDDPSTAQSAAAAATARIVTETQSSEENMRQSQQQYSSTRQIRQKGSLERQNSVEVVSYISSNFSADSLNQPDSSSFSSELSSPDTGSSQSDRSGSRIPLADSCENLLLGGSENGSDTETENLETVKPAAGYSPHSKEEGDEKDILDGEEEEESEGDNGSILAESENTYRRQGFFEDDLESDFLFDQNLSLEVLQGCILPERLDTVEELSEPISVSNSLPHDGGRWPSQNTSLTFSDLAHSLTIAEDELQPLNQSICSNTSKEEPYSVLEVEFGNPTHRKPSYEGEPISGLYSTDPNKKSEQSVVRNDKVKGYTLFGDSSSGERDSNITQRSDLFQNSDSNNTRPLDQTDHSSSSSTQSLISQSVFKQSDHSLTRQDTSNQSFNRSYVTKTLIQQSGANQTVSNSQRNQSDVSNERLSQLKSTKDSLNQSTQQHKNWSVWQNQPLTRSEERLNQSVTKTEQSSQSQSGTELTQSEIRTITKHLSQSEIRNVESKPTAGVNNEEQSESHRSSVSSASSSQTSSNTISEISTRFAEEQARVRQGIYRILSEDAHHSLDKDSSVDEQIDFAELEQRDGEEDSSQSIDLEIRDPKEKHEWEDSEKELKEDWQHDTDDMGCIRGEEQEEREERADPGTDSGIDRVSSAGTNNAGWMQRFGNRMRRARIGSGGQSTASSSPDDRFERPRSASTESPREGGFQTDRNTVLLENRVRELWIRLAQMETDKIKSVEIAVEKERRKWENVVQEERRKVETERIRVEEGRLELKMGTRGMVESQARQVNLVNSLQAKLVKYKSEAEEGRRIISELGGRSKEDVETIASLKGDLELANQNLETQKILARSEVQEWKVKVEEEEERSNTLNHVNSLLRTERDNFAKEVEVNESVMSSLEAELKRIREQIDRSKRTSVSFQVTPTPSEVDNLQRTLTSLRRDYADLKVSSVREVGRMRIELANMARLTSGACLEVTSRINTVQDNNGREIIVGSLQELYSKNEQMKKAKEELEDTVESLERNHEASLRKISQLEVTRQQEAMEISRERTEVKRERSEDHDEDPIRRVRLGRLEGENVLLRSSLQDIASMVTDLSAGSPAAAMGRPRPVTPVRSGGGVRRRARSASPAMVDSTVTAVQSVLHRRQVEVHDMQARLGSIKEKLQQVTKSESKWENKCREVEKELQTSRDQLATLKSEVTEKSEEVEDLQRKLTVTRQEKEEHQAKLNQLSAELQTTAETNQEAERRRTQLQKRVDTLASENRKLEQQLVEAKEELQERGLLISQLERVGSNLREESIQLRERLSAVEREQERLEREKNETETVITEEKHQTTEVINKVRKLEIEERVLQDRIQDKDAVEAKLKADLAVSEILVAGLREEIVEAENRILELESDLASANQASQQRDETVQRLEDELRTSKQERTRLQNQVSSLNLSKDTTADRIGNLTQEINTLKVHQEEYMYASASLNQRKEQLEERLDQREREMLDLKDQLERMEHELERTVDQGEEVRLQLEEEEERTIDLLHENKEKNSLIEQLNNQVCTSKARYLETANQLARLTEEAETELGSERKRLEKRIRRLEEEKAELQTEADKDLLRVKKELEHKRQKEVGEAEARLKAEEARYEDELDYCNQIIDNLRTKNSESLLLAENSRATAERFTEAEESVAASRLAELAEQVEALNRQLNNETKEHILQMEAEKAGSAEVRSELKRVRAKLEDVGSSSRSELQALKDELKRTKGDKDRSDLQFFQLKERIREHEEQVDKLERECREGEARLKETSREEERRRREIDELQTKLTEKNKKIQQNIQEKHTEVDRLESKVEILERSEINLKEELSEVRETLEIHQHSSSTSSEEVERLRLQVRSLTSELELTKSRLNAEANRSRELTRVDELKRRLEEVTFQKQRMDSDLKDVTRTSLDDKDRYESQLDAQRQSLEEGRGREKHLESLRHSLENQLANRGVEYSNLVVRLKGAEGRLAEMTEKVGKLEASKVELEARYHASSHLQQRSSRGATPTRVSRSRYRSGETSRGGDEMDFTSSNVRDLARHAPRTERDLSRHTSRTERDRTEMNERLESLRRSNEEYVRTVSRLDEEKVLLEQRLSSAQLQLNKLEKKVSASDEILADREEAMQNLKSQVKSYERQIRELGSDLTTTQGDLNRADSRLKDADDRTRKYKNEVARLTEGLAEDEDRWGRLEAARKGLEADSARLRDSLEDKETSLKAANEKTERLREEVTGLEQHCNRLTGQLNRVQGELDRSTRMEKELTSQVDNLERALSSGAQEAGGASQEANNLRRRNAELDQERRMLEDRLENSKTLADSLKKKSGEAEERMAELRHRLTEAERGRKESEERLAAAGANAGADSYLKDELNKSRKENLVLQERTRELEKRIKIVKSESKQAKYSNSVDSEKIVRTQIPLMSGKQVVGNDFGEHQLRIRVLEQEAERHIRRISALENQIRQAEAKTQDRVEQLLKEKRQEREKDHTRHTQEIKHLEHSLNTRERMYKERITGLEGQVHTLKDQISQESRSRRSYLQTSKEISADVSDLRRQLDESLENVAATSRLDPDLLIREANRLNETTGRYSSGLTPSRFEPGYRPNSVIRSTTGSLDNLDQLVTSTPLQRSRGQPEVKSSLDTTRSKHRSGTGLRRNLNTDFNNITK